VARQQAIAIPRFRTKEQALTLKKKHRSSAPNDEAEEVKFAKEVLTRIERRPPPQPTVSKKPVDVPPQSALGKQKVSLVNIGGMKGGELSQALMLYRALVNEKIESNWVLPERFSQEKEDLEAVVVVRARRDGTVFDINFEKKSGDSYFDDSVLKAILKSKPFPPFPDIYSPQEEEIVIRFAPENVRS
jgi:TonB family protein